MQATAVRAIACLLTLAACLLSGPAAQADPTPADRLPRLTARLAAATDRAVRLADRLEQAAARDGGLREEADRVAQRREVAQTRLDARVRQVYMAGRPDPLGELASGWASPELRTLGARGESASVEVDRQLVDAVTQQSAQVRTLQHRMEAFRASLRRQAAAALAAQDDARALLARAERLTAAEQLREQAGAQTARFAAGLAARRTSLDDVSAAVTLALTPAQTARTRAAAVDQEPVLALLEAAGTGYPTGYAPTGTVLAGAASWYGPGFVGRPTASGAPYDPERLTCANKEVPLGTVLHVSANGRAVNCLVDDRGPYVGSRILDLSRAGSRALGYDGVTQVVAQVLAPG